MEVPKLLPTVTSMSAPAESDSDGANDGPSDPARPSKRACKDRVNFTNDLRTLLGKTIFDNHSDYSPVLIKGSHKQKEPLTRLVDLINQHLAREHPGKNLVMDNRGVGRWIKECIKCVTQWRKELDTEIKDGGDIDSGADNKVVEEHKQIWLELMDCHEIFISAGGSAASGSGGGVPNEVRGSATVTEGAKDLQTAAENEIALRKEQSIAS